SLWAHRISDRFVSGTVKDEKGEGLPGVHVVAKGTTIGTTTGDNGQFSTTVPDQHRPLVFSHVGSARQELAAGQASHIQATLQPVDDLEEVVVVGFATQKKTNVTGSVSVIGSKELESRPVANVTQALQGLATGIEIGQTSYGGSLEGT